MTTDNAAPTLADIIRALEELYDPAWARDWDQVGLVCGDPAAPVRRVLLAIDPVTSVIDEAIGAGTDLLITHHPLLLRGVHSVAATSAKGRALHRLIRGDCALYTAHTNADAAAPGVSDALARVLGLRDLTALAADAPEPLDKVVTLVPAQSVDAVVDAMGKAGAGERGTDARCAFVGSGTQTSVPGGNERTSEPGRRQDADAHRIEMLAPRSRRADVLAAIRHSHPADNPVIDVYEVASWATPRGIGRVGRLESAMTLREFAMVVGEALPSTAQGVRVAGDPNGMVERVAVCGGSGDSLIEAARAAGVDAFVTSDLRHHPASESRENDAEGTPYLIDVAHWASEWPWLAGVADRLAGRMERAGTPIEVSISMANTDPWTFRVPSTGGVIR